MLTVTCYSFTSGVYKYVNTYDVCTRRRTGVRAEHVQRGARLVRSLYVVYNDIHSNHYII